MDWHEEYYLEHDPEKWSKGSTPHHPDGGWGLAANQGGKEAHPGEQPHGVDIDSQAVEVTKLSLLLKVLEEETGQLSLGFELPCRT